MEFLIDQVIYSSPIMYIPKTRIDAMRLVVGIAEFYQDRDARLYRGLHVRRGPNQCLRQIRLPFSTDGSWGRSLRYAEYSS